MSNTVSVPALAVPANITYGDHTFTIADLPEQTRFALLSRGLAHVLGNEVAAKVSGLKKKALEGTAAGEGVEAVPGRELTEDEIAGHHKAHTATALEAIKSGSLGVRAPGAPRAPAVSPFDAMVNKMAVAEIGSVLARFKDAKGQPLKVPTGEKTIVVGSETRTRAQLLANFFAKPGVRERIETEARKALRAEEQRLAKATANQEELAEALGL